MQRRRSHKIINCRLRSPAVHDGTGIDNYRNFPFFIFSTCARNAVLDLPVGDARGKLSHLLGPITAVNPVNRDYLRSIHPNSTSSGHRKVASINFSKNKYMTMLTSLIRMMCSRSNANMQVERGQFSHFRGSSKLHS